MLWVCCLHLEAVPSSLSLWVRHLPCLSYARQQLLYRHFAKPSLYTRTTAKALRRVEDVTSSSSGALCAAHSRHRAGISVGKSTPPPSSDRRRFQAAARPIWHKQTRSAQICDATACVTNVQGDNAFSYPDRYTYEEQWRKSHRKQTTRPRCAAPSSLSSPIRRRGTNAERRPPRPTHARGRQLHDLLLQMGHAYQR
jgi:hypothetical protein